VRLLEKVNPKAIEMAMGVSMRSLPKIPKARGINPKIVVIEVRSIGLSLVLLASMIASIRSPPSALRLLIKSISTIESFTIIPVRAIIPINDIIPIGVLITIRPIKALIIARGMVNINMNGYIKDLKVLAIII
jgi:hypothetical protein